MADVILVQKGDLKESDFTNEHTNNAQGIGVRVSQQGGNLLEKRHDGLYYGIQAPPDLANLYVANHGDDNAAGTREAPMRTLEAALNRIPNSPQSFTIHLHEGHSFELHTKHWKELILIHIRQYGPQTDTTHPDAGHGNLYYRGYLGADLNRPVINVYTHVTDHSVRRASIIADSIVATAVHIRVHGIPPEVDDGTKGGDMAGIFDTYGRGRVLIQGCIIEVMTAGKPIGDLSGAYRNDVYLRGDLEWTHNKLIPADLSTTKQNNQYSALVAPQYTKYVVLHDVSGSTMVTGTGERKGTVVATIDEGKSYFSINKNVFAEYNRNSRVVYGINFQWDALTTSGL